MSQVHEIPPGGGDGPHAGAHGRDTADAGHGGGDAWALDAAGGGGRRRRLPTQARSRARVQLLLDTVDAIIAAEGFGALTVPKLATQARVPVGSVYQFFPDKTALLEAVAARYERSLVITLAGLTDRIVALPWTEAVDCVIEQFVKLYRENPAFRELWLNSHPNVELAGGSPSANDRMAGLLAQILVHRTEFEDTPALLLTCRVAVEVADGLLRYAFTLSDQGDESIIAELKRLLEGYVMQAAGTRRN